MTQVGELALKVYTCEHMHIANANAHALKPFRKNLIYNWTEVNGSGVRAVYYYKLFHPQFHWYAQCSSLYSVSVHSLHASCSLFSSTHSTYSWIIFTVSYNFVIIHIQCALPFFLLQKLRLVKSAFNSFSFFLLLHLLFFLLFLINFSRCIHLFSELHQKLNEPATWFHSFFYSHSRLHFNGIRAQNVRSERV